MTKKKTASEQIAEEIDQEILNQLKSRSHVSYKSNIGSPAFLTTLTLCGIVAVAPITIWGVTVWTGLTALMAAVGSGFILQKIN